jgi:MscS family membrane protein
MRGVGAARAGHKRKPTMADWFSHIAAQAAPSQLAPSRAWSLLAQSGPTTTGGSNASDSSGVTGIADTWERLQLNTTFEQTTWRGWLILLGAIFGGLLLGKLAEGLLRGIATRLTARGWTARGAVFRGAARPANLAIFSFGLAMGLQFIAKSPAVDRFVLNVIALLYIVAVGWFLYNLVELVEIALRRMAGRTRSTLDDQLVPLVRKTLRLFLVVVLALFTAENIFKADIGAWLAGLGIAGLAVSLAAQDSLKNLFGSVTIFLDRTYMVGELISFDGHTGTVESIGFRSTKMRTLAGELVTIPNSKIVDSSVHNIGRRPHIRRVIDVTITYDTPPDKVERAVQIIREILDDPEIRSAFDLENLPPRVAFNELNADNLNIRVFYWHIPPDYWQFMDHCQKFNLKLLRAFEQAGIEFAFPTRTLMLAADPNRRLGIEIVQPGRSDSP